MDNLAVSAIISLKKSYYNNELYELSSDEKDDYNKIINYLNQDYGFFDIILHFDDFYKLQSIFDKIPDNSNKYIIKNAIIKQFLLVKLAKQSKIDTQVAFKRNIKQLENDLFDGDINRIKETAWLSFNKIENLIIEKAKETKQQYARIFFLLDDVYDEQLQKNINDLFAYRTNIAMIGYTSKKIESNLTSNGSPLQKDIDYKMYVSSKRIKENNKEGMIRK